MPTSISDNMPEKRHPLKHKPLHNPAESAERRLDAAVLDVAVPWLSLVVFAWVFAMLEWLGWALSWPRQPVVFTLLAVAATGLAVWKVRKEIPRFKAMRLGIEGEKYIGQFLERELPAGYWVIHDLCGEGHNIDHVLIGPGGVFTVETKTVSKPGRGEPTVAYDGVRVRVNGATPDRDPIAQARAGAAEVSDILKETTGRCVKVQPVVLYPDWFVQECRDAAVWVLNQNRLIGYLKKQTEVLNPEDIHLYTSRLSEHVRTRDAQHGGEV